MVERLRRLEWYFERAPIYFVTANTLQRRAILANARLRERLIRFAQNGAELGAWLGAFVLMPDHLHAFVAIDAGCDATRANLTIGGWMKAVKGVLSKELRDAGVAGPYWQKGFFDHVLRSSESYAEKWDYVRANPVRAGLVTRAEEWPYSGEPFSLEFRSDS